MTINVSLTPELEAFVRKKVDSGRYTSASEVVREALRLLDVFESKRAVALAKLRAEADLGFKAIEEGNFTEYTEDQIGEIGKGVKRRGRQKLAARLAAQKR